MSPELVQTAVDVLAKIDRLDMANLAASLAGISVAVMTLAYGAFQASRAARTQAVAAIRALPNLTTGQLNDLEARIPDNTPTHRAIMSNLYWCVLLFLLSLSASLGIDPFIEYEVKAVGAPTKAMVFNDAASALPFLSIDVLTQIGPFAFGCILLYRAALKLKTVIVG
jgi:hypothetical protein